MFIFCSKPVSLCCVTISLWGIIQLTFMGILLYTHSVAFSEDLDIHYKEGEALNTFFTRAFTKYESAAHNCWLAVCIYIITLCVSMHQYYMVRKQQHNF